MKHLVPISRRRQKGLSLVEISISLAISGIFVVMFMESRLKEVGQIQIASETSWVIDVVKNIQQGFSTEINFASLSNTYLAGVNAIPKSYVTVAGAVTTVDNGSGGQLYVAGRSLGSPNNAMALTYTGLSSEICGNLITELENTARQKAAPLFALVASPSVLTAVPALTWDSIARGVVATSVGDVVLKQSSSDQLDVAKTAAFCRKKTSLKSITLIRMWAL